MSTTRTLRKALPITDTIADPMGDDLDPLFEAVTVDLPDDTTVRAHYDGHTATAIVRWMRAVDMTVQTFQISLDLEGRKNICLVEAAGIETPSVTVTLGIDSGGAYVEVHKDCEVCA